MNLSSSEAIRISAEAEQALGDRLLLPGSRLYEAARQGAVWRANKLKQCPHAIVMAEIDQDAVQAVRLAKARGWKVGVRSGGHGWSSAQLRDGVLLIEISHMQSVSYDPETKTVSANPSVKGRLINEEIAPYGRMFPGGHQNTVAVGGGAVCGGFGWNAREWGNVAQQIQAIDVVTADGELIHAAEEENADFQWAARGAGTGYFGVVTCFTLSTYEIPKCMRRTSYVFGLDDVKELTTWATSVVNQVPRNLEMFIGAYSSDEGGGWAPTRVTLNGIAFANTETEAHEALSVLDTCPILDRAVLKKVEIPFLLMDGYAAGTAADPQGMRYATDNIYTNVEPAVVGERLQELFRTLPTPRSYVYRLNWGPKWPWTDMALSVQRRIYVAAYAV